MRKQPISLLPYVWFGSSDYTGKEEQKKAFPPKLYDLTSLQREANRYFGYTAKKTLDMLQELYEEKLVTYPRTDSQFVTEDMRDTVEELVGKCQSYFRSWIMDSWDITSPE